MFATTKMVMFTRKHIGWWLTWLWRAQQHDVDCACSENVNNRKNGLHDVVNNEKNDEDNSSATTTPTSTAALTTTTMKRIAPATPSMISMTTAPTSSTDCTCTGLYGVSFSHSTYVTHRKTNKQHHGRRPCTTVTATAYVTIRWNRQADRQTDGWTDAQTDRHMHTTIFCTHSIFQVMLHTMLYENITYHSLHFAHTHTHTHTHTQHMASDAPQHAVRRTAPLHIAYTRHMAGDATQRGV